MRFTDAKTVKDTAGRADWERNASGMDGCHSLEKQHAPTGSNHPSKVIQHCQLPVRNGGTSDSLGSF